MADIFDLFLNLDEHLLRVINDYGAWTYGILFAIIFCETGLIVTPFLPGDSLLFAAGMFAHPDKDKGLNIAVLMGLLMTASFLGDNVNFWIGRKFGLKLYRNEKSKVFKKEHLTKTREFFDKHGSKTIIIGRFVPFVRTFAPFVAGLDAMDYSKFLPASIIGAVTWVSVCTLAGYFFGTIPWVEQNFEIAIIAVIALSMASIVVEAVKSRRKAKKKQSEDES